VFRRVNSSRSPFEADRTHIHHLLENIGYSVKNAVLALSLVQLMLVGMGVVFYLTCAPGWLVFWGFVVVLVLYFYRFKDC
jgi:UDP-GlcNAc:undecaprenyl-phosphate GlcNAc-1-phosphate transferase